MKTSTSGHGDYTVRDLLNVRRSNGVRSEPVVLSFSDSTPTTDVHGKEVLNFGSF